VQRQIDLSKRTLAQNLSYPVKFNSSVRGLSRLSEAQLDMLCKFCDCPRPRGEVGVRCGRVLSVDPL